MHYTQFTLAVDNYKSKEKHTEFLDVVAYGQKATILTTHMSKGRKLFITGKLKNNQYTSADGVKRSTTNVIVDDFEFVDRKVKTEE